MTAWQRIITDSGHWMPERTTFWEAKRKQKRYNVAVSNHRSTAYLNRY